MPEAGGFATPSHAGYREQLACILHGGAASDIAGCNSRVDPGRLTKRAHGRTCVPALAGMLQAKKERMKRISNIRAAWLLLGGALGLAGCVHVTHETETPVYRTAAPAPVIVTTPAVTTTTTSSEVSVNELPPPVPVEETVIEPAPSPEYVWVAGYYDWRGGHWQWKKGHWSKPPHNGAVWVAPKYSSYHGHYVWVPGGWQ